MVRLGGSSLVALGVVATLVGCADEPAGPKPGESFTLSVGQRVTLDTVHASLRFLAVSEDSRCPSQVQCVWAGDGAVVLEIAPAAGDAAEDTLHTNPESGPRGIDLSGYDLTLLQLDPYPEIPGEIPPGEYRATFALYERLEGSPQ
jgi:hypothetical protein